MIDIQFTVKIHVLHSNNGGKYLSNSLVSFFYESGIVRQTTCPGTPKQNRIAKCKNRHLFEIAQVLMFPMNVPKTL